MAEPRRIVLLADGRRPHELFLLAASVLLGIGYLTTVPAPTSLAAVMPAWVVEMWSAGLILSGVIGLLGALWRTSTTSLRVEAGAMLLSSGALVLIGGSSIMVTRQVSFGLGLIAAWSGANLWRAWQIRRELKQLEGATRR